MKNTERTFFKRNFSKKHDIIVSNHTYEMIATKTDSKEKKAF